MLNTSDAEDFEIVTNKAAKAAVWKPIKGIPTIRQPCGSKSRGHRQGAGCMPTLSSCAEIRVTDSVCS